MNSARTCAPISGLNMHASMIQRCASTASIIRCDVIAYAAPAIVTMMLAKTSVYVRRTSVATSSPLRTIVVAGVANLEKPIYTTPRKTGEI
jgi:hypothetical protein